MDSVSELLGTTQGTVIFVAAMAAAGWALFGLDTRKEERRRKAMEIAGKLRGAGFTRLPVFFEDYAVGDYSGAIRSLKDLHDVLSDPLQRAQELEKVLRLLLTDLMRDPEKRQQLLKQIDDLKAANLPDARSVIGDAVGELFSQKSLLDQLGDRKARLVGLLSGLAGSDAPSLMTQAATPGSAPASVPAPANGPAAAA